MSEMPGWYSRIRGCTSKKFYEKESFAEEAKALYEKQFPHQKMKVYRCPKCKNFHLTRVKGKKR